MPNLPAGQPDAVTTDGQAIAFTGSGLTLGFVGMAANGEKSDTGSIVYSDGTTQTYTLTFPDWFTNNVNGVGADQLLGSATVNGQGFQGHTVGIYAADVPLKAGRTIVDIVLPTDSDMHIFAMGLGEPFSSLSDSFNNAAISDDSDPSGANLDGAGTASRNSHWTRPDFPRGRRSPSRASPTRCPTCPPVSPATRSPAARTSRSLDPGRRSASWGWQSGRPMWFRHRDHHLHRRHHSNVHSHLPRLVHGRCGRRTRGSTGRKRHPQLRQRRLQGHPVGIYTAEVPLEAGKIVAFVALPDTGALHIFAMSTG